MNILLLSDNFTKDSEPEKPPNIDIEYVNWTEGRIESFLSEFHMVIVDLNFSTKRTTSSAIKDLYLHFENELSREIVETDGLVMLIICGYDEKRLFEYEVIEEKEPYVSEKYPGAQVTTYEKSEKKPEIRDKLTYSFLSKIDQESYDSIHSGQIGRRYTAPVSKLFRGYFDNVQCFYLTFMGDTGGNVSVISRAQGVGDKPMSWERKIGKGSVIYLPKYDTAKRREVFCSLLGICQEYYLRQQNNVFEDARAKSKSEIPEWVRKYMTDRHHGIPGEIKILKKEEEFFDRICYLLYGKDNRLEDEVSLVLGEFGLTAVKSKGGESIDLICTAENPQFEFFAEVTSSNRSVDTKKVTQFMDIRRRYPDTKVVIIANTFCNLDLDERIGKDAFTEKMVNALAQFDVLMMTTVDLYFLWKGMYEGCIGKLDIVQLLRKRRGVFRCPDRLLPNVNKKGGIVNERLLL